MSCVVGPGGVTICNIIALRHPACYQVVECGDEPAAEEPAAAAGNGGMHQPSCTPYASLCIILMRPYAQSSWYNASLGAKAGSAAKQPGRGASAGGGEEVLRQLLAGSRELAAQKAAGNAAFLASRFTAVRSICRQPPTKQHAETLRPAAGRRGVLGGAGRC